MGNVLTHNFPCQICRRVFQRPIEGSLLCNECRAYNDFKMKSREHKLQMVMDYTIFPIYLLVKDKSCKVRVQHDLVGSYGKELIEKVKHLSQDITFEKKYHLLKTVINVIERESLITNNLRGFYIHCKSSGGIIFAHHSDIRDNERILEIDLDGISTKLMDKN
jgi:hypothetical protein